MYVITAFVSALLFGFSATITNQESFVRDAQRRSDVNTIMNASYQYAIDHNGNLPAGISRQFKEICKSQRTDCGNRLDLSVLEDAYLVSMPKDLLVSETEPGTGYFIRVDATGRLSVKAPKAENDIISITR